MLPLLTPGISNRQHITCVYRCGDQCAAPVPNTTTNPYFGDIATEISRRGALRAAGVVALAVGATQVLPRTAAARALWTPPASAVPSTADPWARTAPST